jgi:hypothetical protein
LKLSQARRFPSCCSSWSPDLKQENHDGHIKKMRICLRTLHESVSDTISSFWAIVLLQTWQESRDVPHGLRIGR